MRCKQSYGYNKEDNYFNMRQLASVQRIVSLSPIEGADRIEKAQVLGWELVVKKNEFKVGDLGVYFEIDSILPDKPEYEFLRARKFRIKTARFQGVISQGLFMPLDVLPKGKYEEGQDVTELLGVVKYDPQAIIEAKESSARHPRNRVDKWLMRYPWYRRLTHRPTKNGFPSQFYKTDEDRIQVHPNLYEKYKGRMFEMREKLDGTSVTYFLLPKKKGWFGKAYRFGVASRNYELLLTDNVYHRMAEKYQVERYLNLLVTIFPAFKNGVAVQGEIIGPNIQGNKYQLEHNAVYFFNVQPANGDRLFPGQVNALLGSVGLPQAPYLGTTEILPTTAEMVQLARIRSVINDKAYAEGVVIRHENLSYKIINPDFLLKHDE